MYLTRNEKLDKAPQKFLFETIDTWCVITSLKIFDQSFGTRLTEKKSTFQTEKTTIWKLITKQHVKYFPEDQLQFLYLKRDSFQN